MLDSPEKYKKGVAFYAARSTFFLPEEEMTEEELLELIDFREKRDYSLAKITEEIEAGDYEYVKTEDSALPGDMSQESGSQQTQGAGEASVVPWGRHCSTGMADCLCGRTQYPVCCGGRTGAVCRWVHHGRESTGGISDLRQRDPGKVL